MRRSDKIGTRNIKVGIERIMILFDRYSAREMPPRAWESEAREKGWGFDGSDSRWLARKTNATDRDDQCGGGRNEAKIRKKGKGSGQRREIRGLVWRRAADFVPVTRQWRKRKREGVTG